MSAGTQQLDLFEDLSYYEGADVEYKSARGGLPSSLWETYSAFANTAGGTLWLGISQGSDGQLRLQGLEIRKSSRVMSTICSTIGKKSVATC